MSLSSLPPSASPRRSFVPRAKMVIRRRLGQYIPDAVWHNWKWDGLAAICAGIYQGCIWTFALQIARGQLHATTNQMGWAVSAPAIGYLFAILWARQMEGRSKLPFITLTWLLARGAFCLTPLLVRGAFAREGFLALIILTPILFSVSNPAYTAVIKEIYPDDLRGRLMSYVRIGMMGAMLITQRVAGELLEHHGLDYRYLFAFGGAFGAMTAYAFSRLKLIPTLAAPSPPVTKFLRETFGILKHNPGYRWFTVSVFVSGFGNLIATTLYPIYQVDRFHITPSQIATMQNLSGIVTMVSLFFWGSFTDRFGSLTAVLAAVSLNCLAPIVYAFAPQLQWLYLAAIIVGVSQSGVDIAYLNTTLMFAKKGKAAQYQALHSTFFGLRGTVAPLAAVQILPLLGGSFPRAFLFCCGIITLGVLCQGLSMRSYRAEQRAAST